MERYFYSKDGTDVQGPIALDDLQRIAAHGILPPETQVCMEGTESWQPLAAVTAAASHKTKAAGFAQAGRKWLIGGVLMLLMLGGAGFFIHRTQQGRKSSAASVSSLSNGSPAQPTVAPIVLPPFHWSQPLPSASEPVPSRPAETKVNDELARAASDAARALQDFYLKFQQPVSEAHFKAQAESTITTLKELQGRVPKDTRVYELIDEGLATISQYQTRVFAAYLFIGSRKMDGGIQALMGASRSSYAPEISRDVEKLEADFTRETAEFRQKIQVLISLFGEQSRTIR